MAGKVINPQQCTENQCGTTKQWCPPNIKNCGLTACIDNQVYVPIPVLNPFTGEEIAYDDIEQINVTVSGYVDSQPVILARYDKDGTNINEHESGNGFLLMLPGSETASWPSGSVNVSVTATVAGQTFEVVKPFMIVVQRIMLPEPTIIVSGFGENNPFEIDGNKTEMIIRYSQTGDAPSGYKFTEFSFDWGDGTTTDVPITNLLFTPQIEHVFPEPGKYDVSVTATMEFPDDNVCYPPIYETIEFCVVIGEYVDIDGWITKENDTITTTINDQHTDCETIIYRWHDQEGTIFFTDDSDNLTSEITVTDYPLVTSGYVEVEVICDEKTGYKQFNFSI